MTREEMIAAVDGEIGRLEMIRGLLKDSRSERFVMPGEAGPEGGVRKRELSPEARRRIALGQKRRWAKQKREGAGVSEAN
jgi:hypothetical protein